MKKHPTSCELTGSIPPNRRLVRPITRARGAKCPGFTLLEILVAMFIFGLVITLVFTSFDGVFSNADHVNASSDLFEMGKTCLDRISADLQDLHVSTYPRYKPPDINDKPEIYRVVGEETNVGGGSFAKLRFTSLAHLALNQDTREGIAEIVYYVQAVDDGTYVLRRADKLYPYPEFEENPADPVMCEKVLGFELTYYDAQSHELKTWNSEEDEYEYSTPRSIAIRLTLGDANASYVFSTEIAPPMYRYRSIKR